jgi:hypothetical protein
MQENLEELARLISLSYGQLLRITDHDAGKPVRPGKWSFKEILGHLIDSASNNHQRIVRSMGAPEISFPAYRQTEWVTLQQYKNRPWVELVSLWRCYNLHLLHVISGIPTGALSHSMTIGEGAPLTLKQLTVEYTTHLRHHLEQIIPPHQQQPERPTDGEGRMTTSEKSE